MLGFFFYFFTFLGILYPIVDAMIFGNMPLSISALALQQVGPPVLFLIAAFSSVFSSRFGGCLAFGASVSCWMAGGAGIYRSAAALFVPGAWDAVGKMSTMELVTYVAGWMPTVFLVLTTLYSLWAVMKTSHSEEPEEDRIAPAQP